VSGCEVTSRTKAAYRMRQAMRVVMIIDKVMSTYRRSNRLMLMQKSQGKDYWHIASEQNDR